MKTSTEMNNQLPTSADKAAEDLELSLEELDTFTGGLRGQIYGGKGLLGGGSGGSGTGGTQSICHIDGTDDADSSIFN